MDENMINKAKGFLIEYLKDKKLVYEQRHPWRQNWVDRSSPYFFSLLLDRVEGFEVEFCNKVRELIKTESARKIFEQRSNYVDSFVAQLKDELMGTLIFNDIRIEEYFK